MNLKTFSRKLLWIPLLALAGCYYDNLKEMYPAAPGGCKTDTVTYAATIQPILQSNCSVSGCHNAGAAAAGIDLSTYAGVKPIALNGRLLGVVSHSSGYSPMPKNGAKLSDCVLSQIQKWVAKGAPEN